MTKINKAALTAAAMAAAEGVVGAVGVPWWVHLIAAAIAGGLASLAHPHTGS